MALLPADALSKNNTKYFKSTEKKQGFNFIYCTLEEKRKNYVLYDVYCGFSNYVVLVFNRVDISDRCGTK